MNNENSLQNQFVKAVLLTERENLIKKIMNNLYEDLKLSLTKRLTT